MKSAKKKCCFKSGASNYNESYVIPGICIKKINWINVNFMSCWQAELTLKSSAWNTAPATLFSR